MLLICEMRAALAARRVCLFFETHSRGGMWSILEVFCGIEMLRDTRRDVRLVVAVLTHVNMRYNYTWNKAPTLVS